MALNIIRQNFWNPELKFGAWKIIEKQKEEEKL